MCESEVRMFNQRVVLSCNRCGAKSAATDVGGLPGLLTGITSVCTKLLPADVFSRCSAPLSLHLELLCPNQLF